MTPRIPQRVLVIDGYGVSITVNRGHLIIADGVADERRERRISRVQPDVERIAVMADTGILSLDAVRWCADVGISLIQVDRQGRPLLTATPPTREDARLRRAQALAPDTEVGTIISRDLLRAKLSGQADVTQQILGDKTAGKAIQALGKQLDNVQDVVGMRALEATAAVAYFKAWTPTVATRFATRDTTKVPDHWKQFTARRTPRGGAKVRFTAVDPVSALLNYLYALATAETRRACLILGLDPGLGLMHTDRGNRDSLALDLLEPVRPHVDAWVLQLLGTRTFTAKDFHETRDGACRVLAPLTHELAATIPLWAEAVAPHAEAVAHTLAATSTKPIRTSTPLTKARARAGAKPLATNRKKQLVAPPMRTCRECGTAVANRNKVCADCWDIIRPKQASETGYQRARQALTEARKRGQDPTQTKSARARRNAAVMKTKRHNREWEAANSDFDSDPEQFRQAVQPGLADVRLSTMQAVTGLSQAACSFIRSGKSIPHPRHWASLAGCVPPTPLEPVPVKELHR